MYRVADKWLIILSQPEYSSTNFPSKKLTPYQLDELVESADWHGVLPSVIKNLNKCSEDFSSGRIVDCKEHSKVFSDIMCKAMSNFRKRAAIQMLLGFQEKQINEEFKKRKIPYMVIKGTQFATRLYESDSLRFSSDVDILVPKKVLTDAADVMLSLGYEPEDPDMKYSSDYGQAGWLRKKQPGGKVEVHWNLVNSPTIRQGVSVTYEQLQLNGNGQVSPASILLIASVHAATSHCFDRLGLLVDILRSVRGIAGEIDLDWLKDTVKRTGATKLMSVAFSLTEKIFKEPLCRKLRKRMDIPYMFLENIILSPSMVMRAHCGIDLARRKLFRELLKRR